MTEQMNTSDQSIRQYYFVQIKILVGAREGFDLAGTIRKISEMLQAYHSWTKCLYRYKVVGETKIIAVYEVTNIMGLERMLNGLTILGYTEVTCDPMITYESFSERIGVNKELTGPSPHDVTAEQCIWADFTVEYPGKTMEDLLETWRLEATAALSVRKGGGHLELFKVCGQRKVHLLIADTAEGFDRISFKLPLMEKNGDNVKIVTKSLLSLDAYVKQITAS